MARAYLSVRQGRVELVRWQCVSKVPLDSACCGLSASAAGLAAGEAVGEEGEEGDDALWFVALAR